jgi:hypothetical protein
MNQRGRHGREVEVQQKKMNPRTGEEESVLDQTEDALVGTDKDVSNPPEKDQPNRNREHTRREERPFLQSP